MPIDIAYIFCHSKQQDWELRYSLRSVAKYAPWVRKVWVLGDRPEWLSGEKSVVEGVPHEYLARPWKLKLPVRNNFWLTLLASLIPDLTPEFLWFADDYILLQELAPAEILRVRVMEDLSTVTTRGRGVWKESLWRTHDLLQRLGYGGLNFECHVPMPMSKRLVWEAFCEFQDYITEDRFHGPLSKSMFYNYAVRRWGLGFLKDPHPGPLPRGEGESWPLVWLKEEGRYAGFHNVVPTPDEVRAKTAGKAFLNFDDAAFPGLQAFLAERFREASKFERQ